MESHALSGGGGDDGGDDGDTIVLVVANKMDLRASQPGAVAAAAAASDVVSEEVGRAFCRELNLPFLQMSAIDTTDDHLVELPILTLIGMLAHANRPSIQWRV